MTEQQDQGDPPGVQRRRARSLRATFRVDEIRARSTPQLVGTVSVIAALATGALWSTIAFVRAGGPFGWGLLVALFLDLVVVICLPGLVVAGSEALQRLWRLLTEDDDGPLLTRSARAAARFTTQARADLNGAFDDLSTPRVLSLMITPLLAVGVAVVVAVEGFHGGWTPAMWVAVGVGVVALWFASLSVPAALGSLSRRYGGWHQ